jgi:hypothetical protein
MGDWIKQIVAGLLDAVLNVLTGATQAALNWVLGLLSATVFTSPDVTGLPQVRFVAGDAQIAANAAMVLVVMVAGILAMTHGSVQDRYTIKELLPRLVIGFAAANLSAPIVSGVINAGNALTQSMAGQRFNSVDSFNQIKRVIHDTTTDPSMFVVALVLRELAMWMLVLLVITWLGRIGVLLIVAGVAPVALMCHALPQTEPVARIWWRSLLSCLAVQVLQAVTLYMAVATLLSPQANLPALGLPNDPTGLFNLLIACFLLWLVIRIPKWVARTFGGPASRGSSILGYIVRVVLIQQALGAIGLRGGKLFGRGRAGAAARGVRQPATHLHSHQHANSHLHQHLHVHPPRPDGRRPTPAPDSPIPATTRAARPHGGRGPVGALPAGPSAGSPSAASTTSPPPGPRITPPGAIPQRRPRWQAAGARPSATGWPTPPPTPPSSAPTTVGRPSGTGWPARLAPRPSHGGSGARRGGEPGGR